MAGRFTIEKRGAAMPVMMRWFDSTETIMVLDISGRWTWDELLRAYDEALPVIQQTTETVYVIMLRAQDMYDTIARMYQPYGRKVGMAATLEEALAQIEQVKLRESQT
jgi:hypothetical protein